MSTKRFKDLTFRDKLYIFDKETLKQRVFVIQYGRHSGFAMNWYCLDENQKEIIIIISEWKSKEIYAQNLNVIGGVIEYVSTVEHYCENEKFQELRRREDEVIKALVDYEAVLSEHGTNDDYRDFSNRISAIILNSDI